MEFPIQLDTGSSDVWVQTPFPINITKDTSIPVNLTFGIGQVAGEIAFTDMEMGDYKVQNQGAPVSTLMFQTNSDLKRGG